ncbi:MAG: TonB-dependent receptor plug domain-containing protein [Flavobacteriales bacterium]
MKIFPFLGIFLLCFASASYSQSTYTFSGRILDAETKESVVGAHIECHETGYMTFSDTTGAFEIPQLKNGQYHLHIEMAGFKAYAEHFTIEGEDVFSALVLLESSHIELRQVNIESEVSKADYRHSSQDLMILDLKSASSIGATNLSQKLAQLPGVNKLESGTGIAKPIIRGLSGNRILVSDLGMKQEGQQWGSDHGLEIDPFINEKVEVIKGPASILYGSDALGGVIRVQTPAIPSKGWSGGLTGIYRSNNDYYGSSVNLNFASNHFFVKSRLTWAEYGDVKLPANSFTYLNRTLPIYNNELKNTAGKDLHYQVTMGWKGVKNVHKLTFSHFHQNNGFFPGLVGIPSGFNVLPDGNTRNIDLPNQQVDHYKLALNSTLVLSKGWLQLDAGWQRNIREERIIPHQQGYAPISESPVAHHLELSTTQIAARWHVPAVNDSSD